MSYLENKMFLYVRYRDTRHIENKMNGLNNLIEKQRFSDRIKKEVQLYVIYRRYHTFKDILYIQKRCKGYIMQNKTTRKLE